MWRGGDHPMSRLFSQRPGLADTSRAMSRENLEIVQAAFWDHAEALDSVGLS
jgi:hypothetical protein